MKLKGKLVKILKAQSGTSKAGKEWTKQEFVLNTGSDYNPEICLTVFGTDKVEGLKQFKIGQILEVDVNVYSREWSGKYYHSIDARQIEVIGGENQDGESDNLPF
tara:strand:+ start:79 stop:393 length:315 start_codon:yes stop_codon:yes gene_type:complete